MRTIARYITTSLTVTFVMTLAVLTFVMCIGVVFKAADLLSRGVPWAPVMQAILCGIPAALAFSIPISALTSVLLVFGRLSSDGEIMAMRVCGISLWRIASGPLTLSVALAALCLYLNNDLAPRGHFYQRSLTTDLDIESSVDLLDEGRFIQDMPGLTIYIGKRDGRQIRDVRIYDTRTEGLTREIRAKSGILHSNTNGIALLIELFQVRVDPLSIEHQGPVFCEKWSLTIPKVPRRRRSREREKDTVFGKLLDSAVNARAYYPKLSPDDLARHRMTLVVELNKRLVLSVCCISFVLLGIPLGIKAHRKESSIGVALSLFLVFNFYLFVIIAEAMTEHPGLRPDIIVWFPVILSFWLGVRLMRRVN